MCITFTIHVAWNTSHLQLHDIYNSCCMTPRETESCLLCIHAAWNTSHLQLHHIYNSWCMTVNTVSSLCLHISYDTHASLSWIVNLTANMNCKCDAHFIWIYSHAQHAYHTKCASHLQFMVHDSKHSQFTQQVPWHFTKGTEPWNLLCELTVNLLCPIRHSKLAFHEGNRAVKCELTVSHKFTQQVPFMVHDSKHSKFTQ